jgi:hypothetical protein
MADRGWARPFCPCAGEWHDFEKVAWRILVPESTTVGEVIATRMPEDQAGVRVVRKHYLLVRISHWLNVPILLGLILSGLSIYWASPVYQHKPDPRTGSLDLLADVGVWICAHVPGLHQYSSPPDWVYNHISLGPGMLAVALRLHWLCAYLFMLNGLVFVTGLVMGTGCVLDSDCGAEASNCEQSGSRVARWRFASKARYRRHLHRVFRDARRPHPTNRSQARHPVAAFC